MLPNLNSDGDHVSYLKRSPNSDGFKEGRSGEEFQLRYVLAPFFNSYSDILGIGPGGFYIRGRFIKGEGIR